MEANRFGWKGRPFRSAPDIAAYYPSTTHERALDELQRAIDDDEGICLVVGEPGVGKTTIGHVLLARLGDRFQTAFLAHGRYAGAASLLLTVLHELGVAHDGQSESIYRLAFADFALESFAQGRKTLVVVDEAHLLGTDLLEEIRLWGNLEAHGEKAVHVVLLAAPSLLDVLRCPELASLNQRLMTRPQVEPLDAHESADYLRHRLRAAGGNPQTLVTDEALDLMARGCSGIPRVLNHAARAAFALADNAEQRQVDAEAVYEALAQLGLEVEPARAAVDEDTPFPESPSGLGCDSEDTKPVADASSKA
jgi:type II secretory pathway predicted ATPase ExeA